MLRSSHGQPGIKGLVPTVCLYCQFCSPFELLKAKNEPGLKNLLFSSVPTGSLILCIAVALLYGIKVFISFVNCYVVC